MTANSPISEAGGPANMHVTEPTDERRSVVQQQAAKTPDFSDGVGSSWQNEAEHEDEQLQQYMEQFFKAHKIGEFSTKDQPLQTAAPVEAAKPRSGETRARADNSRAQEDTAVGNGSSSSETQPIVPRTNAGAKRPSTPREPERPTKPPESVDDLRELRRLVNKNVRQAIRFHAFQQSVWVMRVYLTLGLVCIVCSAGLLLAASGVATSSYVMGVLTFVIAAVACLRYLRLIRVTRQAASSQHHSG